MHINYKVLIRILGLLTLIEGFAMVPCLISGIYFKEWPSVYAFLIIGIVSILIGYMIIRKLNDEKKQLHMSEGFLIASLSWIYCSLLGALPFCFAGGYSFIDGLFESVAGFTTTGATVINIETLSNALLLWRSIENWLGGMGILILIMSVFPTLGITGQSIASAETTGPFFEKLGGKFSDTGKFLYLVYSLFTLLEFLLLWLGPINMFDALTNTLSSISTSGLSIKISNAAAFQTVYVRGVILVFTLLSSINYTLYFLVVKGRFKSFLKNQELRLFFSLIIGSTLLIGIILKLNGTYRSLWQAIKDSLFQVTSFISTSGYYVCDYTKWPSFTIILLFALMMIGGCTMSTSGSLKVFRFLVLLKLVKRGIFKQVHPNAVKAVIVDGEPVPANRASAITSHILLYFIVLLVGALCLSLNNLDMETTITSSLGLFTNTGFSMGIPGTSGYYGVFNGFSKLVLCTLMTAGRLEIYALLLLFTNAFWGIKRKK